MRLHCAASCGCFKPGVDLASLATSSGNDASAGSDDPAPCADKDKSGNCAAWTAAGECTNNPAYMKLKCAASCGTCDQLDFKKRCPMPVDVPPAVPPHAMAETFERALSLFPEYEPQALSTDPYVVSFENFIQPDEIEALLEHADGRFARSKASGGRKGDEFVSLESTIRTSHTTWCDFAGCLQDPRVQRLTERMSNVTRVPANNSEFIQMLRYESCPHASHPECQFYKRHHDTIPELASMPCGPRVYTFFLYLSDVEEGGGTRFDLGFTVQPKAGRAVLWPATFNDQPFVKDDRTHHEAMPVLRGTKYAANFWLHQYDYVTAHHNGCTA